MGSAPNFFAAAKTAMVVARLWRGSAAASS